MFPRAYQLGATEAAAAPAPPAEHIEDAKYVFSRALAQDEAVDDFRIAIEKDSDFELTHLCGKWDQPFSINLYTPGGRLIASTRVKAENFIGTGQFPVPLQRSLIYKRGSQLRLSFANDYAGVNNVEILFCGLKHFDA